MPTVEISSTRIGTGAERTIHTVQIYATRPDIYFHFLSAGAGMANIKTETLDIAVSAICIVNRHKQS